MKFIEDKTECNYNATGSYFKLKFLQIEKIVDPYDRHVIHDKHSFLEGV